MKGLRFFPSLLLRPRETQCMKTLALQGVCGKPSPKEMVFPHKMSYRMLYTPCFWIRQHHLGGFTPYLHRALCGFSKGDLQKWVETVHSTVFYKKGSCMSSPAEIHLGIKRSPLSHPEQGGEFPKEAPG